MSLSVAAAMVVHKGAVAVGLAAYLRSARWPPSRVHKGGSGNCGKAQHQHAEHWEHPAAAAQTCQLPGLEGAGPT